MTRRTLLGVIACGAATGPASGAEGGLAEGWSRKIPIPSPLLGEGDSYVVWVEDGWLQVRRDTGSKSLDWRIALARATDATPPLIEAPAGSFRFSVSYRGGRFFVREDANVLRSVREKKPADWGGTSLDTRGSIQRVGGDRLALFEAKSWFSAVTLANRHPDCLVRLFAAEPDGKLPGYGFEGVTGSSLSRVGNADTWLLDDGEMLVAQRSLEAFQKGKLAEGSEIPPLPLTDLRGRPIDLKDFRGRHLLIDFWATWCGPCIEELPHLRAVRAAFAEDRLAMIGVSLDERAEDVAAFASKHSMPWKHALIVPEGRDRALIYYQLSQIPSIMLVGPDGRLESRGMRGAGIEETVRGALGNSGPRGK